VEHRSTDDLDSESADTDAAEDDATEVDAPVLDGRPADDEPLPDLDPAEARLHAHIATARAEVVNLRSDLESAARADGADMLELRETIVAFHRRQSELERSLEAVAAALVRTSTALNRLSEDVRDLAGPSPVATAGVDDDVDDGGEVVADAGDG
jgi:hypothetical protein